MSGRGHDRLPCTEMGNIITHGMERNVITKKNDRTKDKKRVMMKNDGRTTKKK